ncbi:MAG: biotin--[acetyl-CoA-carboxylase] ligase [Actinomycetota bacterium]|nr:biotin--[acetyl-CoA-carboxylase] ligase [Actinomycetota bacterium]
MTLGSPRMHHRRTDSTNLRARELAAAGAPHGTLVTAAEQTAGRGRQGRTWTAPPNRALLMSLVLRDWPRLLPLAAAVAVAAVAGREAAIKWPNDVQLEGRKVAGILVEGRPREGWMVLGLGLNVAVRPEDFPPELQQTAATLGREPAGVEPALDELLTALTAWLQASQEDVLEAFRARDALFEREVSWAHGTGVAQGIDADGRLVVRTATQTEHLDAGEVHLRPAQQGGGQH